MNEPIRVKIELTITEAEILCRAIQGHHPPQSEEMISIMLYNRVKNGIEEAIKKLKNL